MEMPPVTGQNWAARLVIAHFHCWLPQQSTSNPDLVVIQSHHGQIKAQITDLCCHCFCQSRRLQTGGQNLMKSKPWLHGIDPSTFPEPAGCISTYSVLYLRGPRHLIATRNIKLDLVHHKYSLRCLKLMPLSTCLHKMCNSLTTSEQNDILIVLLPLMLDPVSAVHSGGCIRNEA